MAGNHQIDRDLWDRRAGEAQQRARKLDQKIVCTVAISTSDLLVQVRLLSEFYDESTNGMGHRGALLIQTIVAGIRRVDGGASVEAPMNAVDHICSTRREFDWTPRFEQFRGKLVIR